MIPKTRTRVRTPLKIILEAEVEVEAGEEAGEKGKEIFPMNPDLNPMILSTAEGNQSKDLEIDPKATQEEIQTTREKISFPILMEEQESLTITIPIQIKIQITEITLKEITLLNQREDHIHNHRKKEFPLKNQRKEF